MKIMPKWVLLVVIFYGCIVWNAYSSDNVYRTETYNLYINGKMAQWIEVINQMDANPSQTTQLQMQTLQYYYGVIGHFIDKKQNDKASQALKKADSLLTVVEKKLPEDPVVFGLKSNFIGFRIALSPLKATVLFRGMLKNANKAIEGGKDNAFVNVLYANILFYMPNMFGGDNNKALDCYKQALSIMEQTPGETTDNWLYIQTKISVGLVNEKMENFEAAEQQFQQLMEIEPRYMYVKDVLYPRLLEKKREKNGTN